jgi:hypothetical protein
VKQRIGAGCRTTLVIRAKAAEARELVLDAFPFVIRAKAAEARELVLDAFPFVIPAKAGISCWCGSSGRR